MYKDFYEEQKEQEIKEQQQREMEKQEAQEREDQEKLEEYFKDLDEQKLQERRDEDERVARLKQEIEEERQLKEQLEKEALELEGMDLKRLANEEMDENPDSLKQEEDERLGADAKEQEARSEQERQKTEMKLEQERNARLSVKDYAAGGKGFKEYVNNSSALRFQRRPRMQRLQEERGRQLEWHIRYQNAVQRNELDQWKSRDPENRGEYYQQRIEELEQATSAQLETEIQPVDLDQVLAEYDEDRDVPTQDDILLKEALKENANDILREPQEGKDNVIQFPLNESNQEKPIELTPEELRDANVIVDDSINNDIRPILNKAEHALYERQLGYLMADHIAETDRNALSNYIESFKDDPEKFEKISEHLVSLEALSEKELDEMQQAHFQPEDTERDFLSELDRDEMQMIDKVEDLFLTSLEADDWKFNAKVNLSDAERQHASVYGALDRWIDHHKEHPEVYDLVQEKSLSLIEEMREKWPEHDKLSQKIEQTQIREREQYEQELGEPFGKSVDDSSMALNDGGYNPEEEHAEALSDHSISKGEIIEFPSHKINQEAIVERGESFDSLVDRYAEEGWPAGPEYDTGDYDRDDSDKVNELMGMEEQTKEIDKIQTLAQPVQSNQKQQLKLSHEHHDDDWER